MRPTSFKLRRPMIGPQALKTVPPRQRSCGEGPTLKNPMPYWGRYCCILDALTCAIANVCHLTVTVRGTQVLFVQKPALE